MQSTVLALTLGAAAAFAPVQTATTASTVVKASFESEIGSQAPLGSSILYKNLKQLTIFRHHTCL